MSYAFRESGVNGNTVVGVLGRHYIQEMSAYVRQLLAGGDFGIGKRWDEFLLKCPIYDLIEKYCIQDCTHANRKLNNYLAWRLFSEFVDDLSIEYVHASRKFYEARTGPQRVNTYSFRYICIVLR